MLTANIQGLLAWINVRKLTPRGFAAASLRNPFVTEYLSASIGEAHTGRITVKFDTGGTLINISRKNPNSIKIGHSYEGNSISKLQIQVATYVFELSAGNCHR